MEEAGLQEAQLELRERGGFLLHSAWVAVGEEVEVVGGRLHRWGWQESGSRWKKVAGVEVGEGLVWLIRGSKPCLEGEETS